MQHQEIQHLMQVIRRLVGNKVYLSDVEKILQASELSPQEKQSIRFLAQDLAHSEHKLSQKKYY